MAAQDNLSPQQFMSVHDLAGAESQYGDWGKKISIGEAYDHPERRVLSPSEPARRIDDTKYPQAALTDNLRQHGIQEPITLGHHDWQGKKKADGFTVYDGHHRYFSARDMGMSQVPVEWAD